MNVIHFRPGYALFNDENELYSFGMEPQDPSPAQNRKSSAILDAARVHFASHGFEATRLSDVARDAGVAVGTIYLRFKGKAELLGGVLDHVEASLCAVMDTPDIWAAPFPQRFRDIVAAVVSSAGHQADLAHLMALAAFAPQSPRSDKHGMLGLIEAHIRDGAARGELRGDVDPALAARMAHGMVDGALRDLMTNPTRDPNAAVTHVADAYARWLVKP